MKTKLPDSWVAHDKSVRGYHYKHKALSWTRSLLGLFLVVIFLRSYAMPFVELVETWTSARYLQWLLFFGVIGAAWEVVGFPFQVISHGIEKSYKLSKQNFGGWFWDVVKGWMVGVVIGAIVLSLLYVCVAFFGENWWVPACLGLLGFSILLAQLAPVILIPLFFKLKPMEASPLKTRLFEVCKKFGVHVEDVYHLGMGEKTEKGNAAFVGLGRTKKILIGDTLYEKFPHEQVEAVFIHELGHQVHWDLWRGIAISSVTLIFSFWLANSVAHRFFASYYTDITHPLGMFLFFVCFTVIQIPLGVFMAWHSRTREWAADNFSRNVPTAPNELANALEKLTVQNFGFFRPNPILEFLGHSHPAPYRRILSLRNS